MKLIAVTLSGFSMGYLFSATFISPPVTTGNATVVLVFGFLAWAFLLLDVIKEDSR